jgi:hypothetical protein
MKGRINENLAARGANFGIKTEAEAQMVIDEAVKEVVNRDVKGREDELKNSIRVDKEGGEGVEGYYFYDIGDFAEAATSIAEVDGKLVLRLFSLEVKPKSLAVGFHIGQILLERVIEDAKKFNCDEIILHAKKIRLHGKEKSSSEAWYQESNIEIPPGLNEEEYDVKKNGSHPYFFYKKSGFMPDYRVEENGGRVITNLDDVKKKLISDDFIPMVKFLDKK